MVENLWKHLLQKIEHSKTFLRFLTENTLQAGRPPINNWDWKLRSLFGFAPPPLDIKIEGFGPLVMAARVLSLSCLSSVTHTLERLDVIKNKGVLSTALIEALKDAYDFMMLLRIRKDLTRSEDVSQNDNLIHFKNLNLLQRLFLKDSLQTVYELQDEVASRMGVTGY